MPWLKPATVPASRCGALSAATSYSVDVLCMSRRSSPLNWASSLTSAVSMVFLTVMGCWLPVLAVASVPASTTVPGATAVLRDIDVVMLPRS